MILFTQKTRVANRKKLVMTGTPVMRWRNSSGVICRFLAEWLMGVVRPEETLEDAPVRLSSPAGSRVRIRIAIMLEGTRYSQ